MAGNHARVSISRLGLTHACNGSLQLQEQAPPVPETEQEAEGTAADVVAMSHIENRPLQIGEKFEVIHEGGPRTWEVTEEMFYGAQMLLHAVGGWHGDLRVHDAVKATALHHELCWGTPDVWRFYPQGKGPSQVPVLACWEYKYGHRFVDEFENKQLTGYFVGIMERLQLSDENLILEYGVVQPRCFSGEPVRVWRVPAVEIRPLVNALAASVEEALSPEPYTKTGNHCMDCKARHLCKTLQESSASIVTYAGTAESHGLNPYSMGVELRMLTDAMKQLEARQVGLKAQIEAFLRAGQTVPGWSLEPLRSNRKWNDDTTPQYIADSFAMLGIDVRKPLSVMTPTQAIDAGVDESIVMEYAHRPTPALGVKPIKNEKLRKIFYGANRT